MTQMTADEVAATAGYLDGLRVEFQATSTVMWRAKTRAEEARCRNDEAGTQEHMQTYGEMTKRARLLYRDISEAETALARHQLPF